jgi:Endoplasmic Reticulum Oxidoreductin 1 (ERO1)
MCAIVWLQHCVRHCVFHIECISLIYIYIYTLVLYRYASQSKTFFKYFKVDYLKECPFWVEEYLCSASEGSDCGVCPCEEEEIPEAFREQDQFSRANTALVSDFHGWNDSNDTQPWIYQEEDDGTAVSLDGSSGCFSTTHCVHVMC